MKASIIVPSYNASDRLLYNLHSLNNQDYFKNNYEVIVINNGSTDDTKQMLTRFIPKFKLSVIDLSPNMGRAHARNEGINRSNNEIIIFHDSDMIAKRDFIRRHMENHTSNDLVVCGVAWKAMYSFYYKNFSQDQHESLKGYMRKFGLTLDLSQLKDKQPLFGKRAIDDGSFLKRSYDAKPAHLPVLDYYGPDLDGFNFPWEFFVTNNCSVHRSNLEKTGAFDEGFVGWGYEDTDLGYRLYQSGCKFIVRTNIISVHQEHPKIAWDINQALINKAYFICKHDSINVLLYYLWRFSDIPAHEINPIMQEVDLVQKAKGFEYLLELFQASLIHLRNKVYKNLEDEPAPGFDPERVNAECNELSNKIGASHFIRALRKLVNID